MTIEELDRRFGAPGRIAFRTGHCGYPEASIANKFGSAEIALLGANTLSYRPTGHHPVIFRPAKRDYARGESFHGGIPVCFPQFGKLAIPGMAQHGFARLMPFDVRSTRYTEDMTEIVLGLASSPDTLAVWPHEFDLEVKISVSMKLNLSLKVVNTGKESFEWTGGFHPYFTVRERDAVTVKGLSGCDYVYAVDMSTHTLAGDLEMKEATDHVFSLPPVLKHEFAVLDPGLKRAIAMASNGNRTAIVWNPGAECRLPDMAEDDWRRFVCVEPVTDWPKATSVLEPGGKYVLTAAIQSTAEQ